MGTNASQVVSPGSTTTYTVTGTSSGCTGSTSVTVTVNPNPVVTFTPSNPTICDGNSVTIGADGATTYSWSHGLGTGSSKLVSPTTTTTYTVTGTLGSCTGSSQVTVTVNPTPTVSVSPSSPAICAGGSTTINASGASTYSWSHSMGSNASQVVSPGSTTTYTVTGTSLGCSGSTSVTVTVNPLPNVSLNASSTNICEGEDVTLTAGGASNYTWSPSGSGGSHLVSPSATTTWYITGTDGNNCSNIAQVTINVSASYDATITTVAPMCLNASAFNLTAVDAGGVWTGQGITNPSTGLFNPSVAGAGTHTITYGIAGACGDTGTVQVTVYPLPNVSLNASSTNICEGEDVTLTAGGASNYTWSPSGSGGSHLVSPSATTTWHITGTDGNNCSNTAQITINVSSAFDATITPVGSVCSNETAFNLTAVDGGGVWSGAGITNTSTGLFNPSIAGAGTHQITYTIFGACGDADTITITVVQAPVVTLIANNYTICLGDDVLLTASGADSYVWSPSGTGTSNTYSPSATTVYYVTGTANGCENTASVTITVNDLPGVSLVASDEEICDGEQVSLTAGGGNTYSWSNSGSGNPINVSPSTTTTYIVTGTDGNGCENTASVTITVHDTPDVDLIASETSICEGDTVVITASGADSYLWSPSGSGSGGEFYPSSTTTYSVTGSNSYNCTATASVTITVIPPQDATIVTNGPFCSGDDPVVLLAVDGGGNWSGTGIVNSSSGVFDPGVAGPGSHSVTYTIPGNCGDTDSKEFIVFESPLVTIVPTPISCDGAEDGQLYVSISGGLEPYDIFWNIGSSELTLTDLPAGNYSVVVVDDNGCNVTRGINLDDPGIPCDAYTPHAVVPNVFSPNGDGQNDILFVRGEGIMSLEFVVYTRWGEKVFETTDINTGWDGTYQGVPLDPAVFVYYLKATLVNYEEIIQSGDVTLIK